MWPVTAAAQAGRPPLPPPPLSQETLCALDLERLLDQGIEGTDTIEDRDAAHQRVEQLYQREVDRLRQQVIDEEGLLAFAVFTLAEKSRGEQRLEELLAENCLHQALLRAQQSREAEVRTRAKAIWDRFYAPPAAGGVFTLPPEEELPKPGPKGVIGKVGLGVNVPPAEMLRPGATFTGTVAVDPPPTDASGRSIPPSAVLSGLVIELEGKRTPVNLDGRFVFEVPAAETLDFRLEGFRDTTPVRLEGEVQPLLEFDVALGRSAPPARERESAPPREVPDPTSPHQVTAPPVVRASDPLILGGDQRGGGQGLTTRAFLDDLELPLLWKTPQATALDLSHAPAGPHLLTLWEGGTPVGGGLVSVVRLDAESDRQTLRRGEEAQFTVRISGLPKWLWAAAPSRPTLVYDNHTIEVGRFVGRDQHFEVPIELDRCTPEPTSWSSVSREPAPPPRSVQPIAAPLVLDAQLFWSPLLTNEKIKPTFEMFTYQDLQHYRAKTAGQFVVNVRIELPPAATAPVILQPLGPAPGADDVAAAGTRVPTAPPTPLPIVRDGGKEYFQFPDGRRVERDWRRGEGYVLSDGTVVIDRGPRFGETRYHPDGTVAYDDSANDRLTTTRPDGTRSVLDKRKGIETVTTPDGKTQEFWWPGNRTRIEKPFGATSYELRADGTIVIDYNRYSGREDTTIYPDGTRVTNYTNDKRIETRPDGTRIVLDKRAMIETIESPHAPLRIFDVLNDGTRVEQAGPRCLESCQDSSQESCRTRCAAACGESCTGATGCDCWTSCRDDCASDCEESPAWQCDQVCPDK